MVLPAALPPELSALAERVRPVALAADRVLPLSGPLAAVLPALGRGEILTVAGSGATSFALGVVEGMARGTSGSWVVVMGLPELAPSAVHDVGLDPARVAFVDPGTTGRHLDALAALVGAVDLVVIDARLPLRAADARRLAARARERGSVMVVVQPGVDPSRWRTGGSVPRIWPADVACTVRAERWWGVERGNGHLRSRELEVHVTGRGRHARGACHRLALPALDGGIEVLDPTPVRDATVLRFTG